MARTSKRTKKRTKKQPSQGARAKTSKRGSSKPRRPAKTQKRSSSVARKVKGTAKKAAKAAAVAAGLAAVETVLTELSPAEKKPTRDNTNGEEKR